MFSLLCKQNNNIMESGKNSKTKNILLAELLNYLSVDHDDETLAMLATETPDTVAEMYDFEIIET